MPVDIRQVATEAGDSFVWFLEVVAINPARILVIKKTKFKEIVTLNQIKENLI